MWVRCILVLLLGVSGLAAQRNPELSLDRLFTTEGLLRDRDGDGHPDGLAARILLDGMDAGVAAAAAEVAARLGLEVCALDGSLLGREEGRVIRFSRLPQEGDAERAVGSLLLEGGEVRVSGRGPGALLAAARALAGFLPEVPGSGGLADLRQDVAGWLEVGEKEREELIFDRLLVEPGRRRWRSLRARVRVGQEVFEKLRARHDAGEFENRRHGAAGIEILEVVVTSKGLGEMTLRFSSPSAEMPASDGVPRGGKARRFGLQDLFGIKGVLTDGDGDLVPDGCMAFVVPSGEPGSEGAADVALRLGLETAGLRFPLTALPGEIAAADVKGPLILVGDHQPLVGDLVKRGKLSLGELSAGEGEVRLVLRAFGEQPAVVVRGADARGLLRATRLLLERVPHLVPSRTGAPDLADLATEARRFLGGISPGGQAARVLREARVLRTHPDFEEEMKAFVALEGLPREESGRRALLRHLRRRLRLGMAALEECDPRRPEGQRPLLQERIELPWEVDRHRLLMGREVLPLLKRGQEVVIEVLVSEPKRERKALAEEISKSVFRRTRVKPRVRVLSAWKQGFSWLLDVVLPAARKVGVERVEIAAPLYTERSSARWATLNARARWFLELHPALEILAAELKLDVDRDISLVTVPEARRKDADLPAVVYEARLFRLGSTTPIVLRFDPALRRMPFSRVFPGYESVVVSTGRLRVSEPGGARIFEALVQTDLETLWETYQEKVLRRLRDHLLDVSRGRPESIQAPLFALLDIQAEVSEADRPLPVAKEIFSPAEALYEEFYFHSLWFASFVGQVYAGKPLRYPGSVIPDVQVRPGGAPVLKVRLLAKRRPFPGLWTSADGLQGPFRRMPRVKIDQPRIVGLRVGPSGRLQVSLRVRCESDRDRRAEMVRRAPPEEVDSDLLAAETGEELVREAGILRGLGLHRDSFSLPGVDALRFEFEHPGGVRRAALSLEGAEPETVTPPQPDVGPIRISDTRPLSPAETSRLLAGLAREGGAAIYRAGRSYVGHDLWALETGPVGARHYSRRKLAAWKPVLLISAREHANEVSSTNHVLLFLQECLNNEEVLDRVTLVVQPVWNADGASIAVTQFQSHKTWMLHAGYLGALGENLAAGMNDADPVHPESRLRLEMFRRHLPDVFLNPHGYPTHEWVQPFSGYAAWVRGRAPKTRDWWGPRGWFLQHFTWPRGEEYGEQKEAALALRDEIVKAIAAIEGVMSASREQQRRYLRYGRFDPDTYRVPLVNGVLVNGPLFGSKPKKDSTNFALRHPKTCFFFGITEAPDETAHGLWLRLVCQAGKAFDGASLRHLMRGDPRLKVKVRRYRDGTVRSRLRRRPVMPVAAEAPGKASGAKESR